MSLVLGLTGGIATGKSTVAAMVRKYGIPVLDADRIAHQLMEKDTSVYRDIVRIFGKEILTPSGEIARKRLGHIVFNDPNRLKRLNEVVHPAVRRTMENEVCRLQNDGARLIVLDVPLLFESGFDDLCDRTVVVYTDEKTQLERLMKRNGLSQHEALKRIQSQMPINEKVIRADDVIDNSFTMEWTKKQVDVLIKRLLNE